jgi:hypothetical protein
MAPKMSKLSGVFGLRLCSKKGGPILKERCPFEIRNSVIITTIPTLVCNSLVF